LTKKRIEIKLNDQKKKCKRQFQEIEKQKDLDIKDLQKRYSDLQKQKQLQDKQNFSAMQKMEGNHLAQVEELQVLYEKKLLAQDADYLNLEQAKLEMQKLYETKIRDLIEQNKLSIQRLLTEFRGNLTKVQKEYEDCKATSTTLKDYYD